MRTCPVVCLPVDLSPGFRPPCLLSMWHQWHQTPCVFYCNHHRAPHAIHVLVLLCRYKKFSGGDALAQFPMCLLASDIGSDIGSDGWPGILQLKVGLGAGRSRGKGTLQTQ